MTEILKNGDFKHTSFGFLCSSSASFAPGPNEQWYINHQSNVGSPDLYSEGEGAVWEIQGLHPPWLTGNINHFHGGPWAPFPHGLAVDASWKQVALSQEMVYRVQSPCTLCHSENDCGSWSIIPCLRSLWDCTLPLCPLLRALLKCNPRSCTVLVFKAFLIKKLWIHLIPFDGEIFKSSKCSKVPIFYLKSRRVGPLTPLCAFENLPLNL